MTVGMGFIGRKILVHDKVELTSLYLKEDIKDALYGEHHRMQFQTSSTKEVN